MLKWGWLENKNTYSGFYNDASERMMWGIIPSFVIFMFDLISWGYIPLWINIAVILFGVIMWILLMIAPVFTKLYYLNGYSEEQKSAVRWYDSLSDTERKLLPHGWRELVLEKGTERYEHPGHYIYSIAHAMHESAKELVNLHRESERLKNVDYRAKSQINFMKEMSASLSVEINDRKKIEASLQDD